MPVDVLVLDDEEGPGQEYSRLIRIQTGLEVVCTTDTGTALRLVRENSVKVAVLDQRIGAQRGTDVFTEIRKIDKTVRAVMFTGLADAQEVGSALSQGYAAYVGKNDVANLAGVILSEFQKYQVHAALDAVQHERPTLYTRRHGFPRRKVEYSLLNIEISDERLIPADAWRTVASIRAGEEQRLTESNASKHSVSIENESQRKFSTDLGLKVTEVLDLSSALRTEVTDRLKSVTSSEQALSSTRETLYKLPAEPTDPSALHVKARKIEKATVRRRLKATILVRCSCCGLTNILPVTLAEETGRTAVRHVDTLSDGVVRTVESPDERW